MIEEIIKLLTAPQFRGHHTTQPMSTINIQVYDDGSGCIHLTLASGGYNDSARDVVLAEFETPEDFHLKWQELLKEYRVCQ